MSQRSPSLSKMDAIEVARLAFNSSNEKIIESFRGVKNREEPIQLTIRGKTVKFKIKLRNGTEEELVMERASESRILPSGIIQYNQSLEKCIESTFHQILSIFPSNQFDAHFSNVRLSMLHLLSTFSFRNVTIQDDIINSVALSILLDNLLITERITINSIVTGNCEFLKTLEPPSLHISNSSWLTKDHLFAIPCSIIKCSKATLLNTYDFMEFVNSWLSGAPRAKPFQYLEIEFDNKEECLPIGYLEPIGAKLMGHDQLNIDCGCKRWCQKCLVVGYHIKRADGVGANLILRKDSVKMVTRSHYEWIPDTS